MNIEYIRHFNGLSSELLKYLQTKQRLAFTIRLPDIDIGVVEVLHNISVGGSDINDKFNVDDDKDIVLTFVERELSASEFDMIRNYKKNNFIHI